MLTIVVDTNIWIRALLAGKVTLPVLEAWLADKFQVVVSEPLLDELDNVCKRPRFTNRINPELAGRLITQLRQKGIWVTPTTVPPRCRDPRDHPVLATAIDGRVNAILSGDADLRADGGLRKEMAAYGIDIWGIDSLLDRI